MANNAQLKTAIAEVIKTNGNREITGALLQQSLIAIINQFGTGSIFKGFAELNTNPGNPDANVFYIAYKPGVYPNFGGYELTGKKIVIFNNIDGAFQPVVFFDLSIINDLNSTDINSPLSAFMGNQLNLKTGSTALLTRASLIPSKLMFPNGNIVDTTLSFGLAEYNVMPNSILYVYANIQPVNNSYAVVSFYNGSVWVSDVYFGEGAGVTTINKVIEVPSTANRVLITYYTTMLDSLIVFQSMPLFKRPLGAGEVREISISDGSVTSPKIGSKAKIELAGGYSVKSSVSVQNNKLIMAGGAVTDTTFTYAVSEFAVLPNSVVHVHTELTGSMNGNTYSLISCYNGNTWLYDAFLSVSGQLIYDAVLQTGSTVNKILVVSQISRVSEVLVTQNGRSSFVLEDGSVTSSKINDRTKLELGGYYTVLTASAERNVKLMRPNGVIVDAPNATAWLIQEFECLPNNLIKYYTDILFAINNSYTVIAFYNYTNGVYTWISDVQLGIAGTRIYGGSAQVPATANRFFITSHNTTKASILVTQQALPYVDNSASLPQTDVATPALVYGLTFDALTLNCYNRLYVEGIMKVATEGMKINGEQSIILDSVGTGAANTNITFSVSEPNKRDVSKTLSYRRTPITQANNKTVLPQFIGDSLTEGNYPAVAEFLTLCWKADLAASLGTFKFITIGTRRPGNLTINIDNRSYPTRGCHEGSGGWAISDYLRKFILTRSRPGSSNSATLITGKAAWDSLGLGTMTRNGVPGRPYQTFVYSQAVGELVRVTCHGWYDADPTPELWDWIGVSRGMANQSFTYNGTTYTFGGSYTVADDEAQKAYIKYLCEFGTGNKFFDYATVQSSGGSHGFNYTAYQNKYRTIDQNGNRLVVGSTAGSMVTNADAFDVCVPTHVVIFMNENDYNNVDSGIGVAQDHLLMASLINAAYPAVKVSVGATRGYGVNDPAAYNNLGYLNKYVFSSRKYDTNVYLQANAPASVTYLPLYYIGSPFGTRRGRAVDALDQYSKIRYNGDGIHALYPEGYLDRAYLTLAWIWSTI